MGSCATSAAGNNSSGQPDSIYQGDGRECGVNITSAPPTSTKERTQDPGQTVDADQGRTCRGLILGDTLGKGTFGYVKKGLNPKDGKAYALKFLLKNNKRFKLATVELEINCMKKVNHPNVVRLLDSDLSCMYPNKDGGVDETVLMVLEYAAGGDLYDILFYTGRLEEKLVRTYFLQLIAGLEAIHAAGITHRDMKANNILLDHNYELKITDFGLSHIYEGERIEDNRMKTCWVGTKGYQAPELVLNRPYSHLADIFSTGVVIFTLLCGHQPFKNAAANDPWYKLIAAKKHHKFWKAHKTTTEQLSEEAKDIVVNMLAYQPRERMTIEQLRAHPWCSEPIYDGHELKETMKTLHKQAVEKKLVDPKHQERIKMSQVKRSPKFIAENQSVPVPKQICPLSAFDVYEVKENVEPIEVIDCVRDTAIEHKGQGDWIPEEYKVRVTLTAADNETDTLWHCDFSVVDRNGVLVLVISREKDSELPLVEQTKLFQKIWDMVSVKISGIYYEEEDPDAYDYGDDFAFPDCA